MGLDGGDILDDGDGVGGGGGGEGEGEALVTVPCSICLDAVTDNGDRSWAKLQCGHQFHLDCIGSAFNAKGAMQCPNCRKIEKGQWLYATGCRQLPEFNMDEFAHDEDLYDLSYSEMFLQSIGVHWCPFSGLTRLPSSFEEGEYSSTACKIMKFLDNTLSLLSIQLYHLRVIHAHILPTLDQSIPHHQIQMLAFPMVLILIIIGMVHLYQMRYLHLMLSLAWMFIITVGITIPPLSLRQAVALVVLINPQSHPRLKEQLERILMFRDRDPLCILSLLVTGHSSAARAGSSVVSSMIPPYPGSVARTRDRVQALQAYFQQPSNTPSIRNPVMSGSRRSSAHRSVAQVGPVASSSDQTGAFYFIPSSSSGRTYQEAENSLPNRFHGWDREHLPSFPSSQIDRDSGWGPFHQAAGGADGSLRTNSFRQRHGPERMPSQNRS
nr:uncharacterized protein LOC113732885 isoform X1 [Coffea arabica]